MRCSRCRGSCFGSSGFLPDSDKSSICQKPRRGRRPNRSYRSIDTRFHLRICCPRTRYAGACGRGTGFPRGICRANAGPGRGDCSRSNSACSAGARCTSARTAGCNSPCNAAGTTCACSASPHRDNTRAAACNSSRCCAASSAPVYGGNSAGNLSRQYSRAASKTFAGQ